MPEPEPLLVRACRLEAVERTPVWFMRQAGRSLPEYRALRERYSFFEVAGNPELCAEVTLQPVRRHDVDAAVMFADIMTPVAAMGVELELVEGVGPVIEHPIRTAADVERLRVPDPEEAVASVLEAIRIVRAALPSEKAVIGFCGGPFTVAGYLVEGKPSRDFLTVKALMHNDMTVWHELMKKLADTFSAYLQAQVRAGADVVQLFDSWVGVLSASDYETHARVYSLDVLRSVDVPTIHFGTSTAGLLPLMEGDVIGVDWRIELRDAWHQIGIDARGIQGNLDPAALLAPWSHVESETEIILSQAQGRPGHVFNLGHGVLPETDPDVLTRVVELVRLDATRRATS